MNDGGGGRFRIGCWAAVALAALCVLVIGCWGTLFLLVAGAGDATVRGALAIAFGLASAATFITVFVPRWRLRQHAIIPRSHVVSMFLASACMADDKGEMTNVAQFELDHPSERSNTRTPFMTSLALSDLRRA